MKPIITNPEKFIKAIISEFYTRSIEVKGEEFDPEDYYTSGHCAEFSYSLAKFASKQGIDCGVSIIYRIEKDIDTEEESSRTFSHCVFEIPHVGNYDINGENADEKWIESFDDLDDNKWNLENDWEYTDIPFNKDNEQETYEALKKHCEIFNVPLIVSSIEQDVEILSSIINQKELENEYV